MKNKIFVMAVLLFPIIAGCAGSNLFSKGDSGQPQQESQPTPPPQPAPPALPSQLSLMGTDFDDVDIPDELKLSEGESILMNTANFVGGSLVYSANVTVDSVIRFFKTQMPKKGWEFLASSFARNNAIIAFKKPNKNCVIHITGPAGWQLQTKIHVWIGNSKDMAPSEKILPLR
ncbi:MAG: hypothetical protein L7F77_00145 [Candidatus Magnetominusculus sp. LBB02]|nr:hypothetical protein [Candidatus Magnetominusculus sp. LBB02]